MLINFCDPVLKPVIFTSGACHEGHNVTNLVSSVISERRRGYLGYGSPPTTITIEFISHINIKHIVIGPQVRSKKSLGFEISVKRNSKLEATNAGGRPRPTIHLSLDDYERIGSTILGETDNGVVFYKNNYKPKTDIEPNFTYISLFKSFAVGNTNCIQIKIFKALSSVPAIGRIEVWGEPGRSCSRSFKNHIYKLWYQNQSYKSNPSNNAASILSSGSKVEALHSGIEHYGPYTDLDTLQLPEEFLDSITCNIMTLPFILPSGKVVDIQTLEKHKNYEAMYGRLPSDPFTGIRFSRESLPIPDHDLKRRIDRFLAENSHRAEVQNVPRTTGTKSKSFSDQTERILGLPVNPKKGEHKSEYIAPYSRRSPKSIWSSQHAIGRLTVRGMVESLIPKPTRPDQHHLNKTRDSSQTKRKVQDIEGIELLKKRSKANTVISPSTTNNSSQMVSINKIHEQVLDDSLDSALKSALAGLPSFARFHSESQKVEPKENLCQCCKTPEMLFIFPCKSLVCRNCLPAIIGKKICVHCDSSHQSSDAVRYHYQ